MATNKSEETEAETKVVTQPAPAVVTKPVSPLWWVLGTLVGVVLLIFTVGAIKLASDRDDNTRFGMPGGMMERSFERGGMRGGMRDSNSDTSAHGVVTSISGDTISIAGNGSTKEIKTTDKTEYFGAAQPVKVNDSVRIQGTTTDNTFTATQVMISRQ